MAKAGYEEMARRKEAIIGSDVPTWEDQTDEMREEYLALAGAIHQSLGDSRSRRRSVMPVIACAIVLAFLGGFATAFWTAGSNGLPWLAGVDGASPAASNGTPTDLGAQRPGADAATASVTAPEVAAPTNDVPAPEPAVPSVPAQEPAVPSPSPSEPANRDLAAAPTERPEPPTTTCTVALDPWPADATEQGKAIQVLLRDLGFYTGPVSGTVGPLTRAAIRKFQLAAKEAATGEPSKLLFESLKKKKCASIAP